MSSGSGSSSSSSSSRRFSLPARLTNSPQPNPILRTSFSGSSSLSSSSSSTITEKPDKVNKRRSKLGFLNNRFQKVEELEFQCNGTEEDIIDDIVPRAPTRLRDSSYRNSFTHSRATSSTSESSNSSNYSGASTAESSIYSSSNSYNSPHSFPTIVSKSPISATFPSIADYPTTSSYNPTSSQDLNRLSRTLGLQDDISQIPSSRNLEDRRLSLAAAEREAIEALNFYFQSPREQSDGGRRRSRDIWRRPSAGAMPIELDCPIEVELEELEDFVTLLPSFQQSSFTPASPEDSPSPIEETCSSPDIQTELDSLSIYFNSPPPSISNTRASSPTLLFLGAPRCTPLDLSAPKLVRPDQSRRTQSHSVIGSKPTALARTTSYGWI